MALLVHFVLLKNYFGWYLFPEHVSEFDLSWENFGWRIRNTLNYIFVRDGRKFLLVIFVALAIFLNKGIALGYRLFLGLLFFALTKVFFRYWDTIDFVEIYIIPILFVFIVRYWFLSKTIAEDAQKRDFIGVSLVFSIAYSLFSSAYFDNLRYLFYVIPFFIIVACYYVSRFPYYSKLVVALFSVASVSLSLYYISIDENTGDVNLAYTDVAKLYSKTINYLEDSEYYDHTLKVPYLYANALSRPSVAYLRSDRVFTNLTSIEDFSDCRDCILVFTNTEEKNKMYEVIKDDPNYKLLKRFTEGRVWSEVYYKKE